VECAASVVWQARAEIRCATGYASAARELGSTFVRAGRLFGTALCTIVGRLPPRNSNSTQWYKKVVVFFVQIDYNADINPKRKRGC
jgi:hypothetical protein